MNTGGEQNRQGWSSRFRDSEELETDPVSALPSDLQIVAGCDIIAFPSGPSASLRRLALELANSVGSGSDASGCELRGFCGNIEPEGRTLRIDAHAVVEILPGSRDYRFVIRLNEGAHCFLLTDDLFMMADFVRQYVLAKVGSIARVESHP